MKAFYENIFLNNKLKKENDKKIDIFLKSKQSTTKYFKELFLEDFNIVLLNKMWRKVAKQEQKNLKIPKEEKVFVREVLLCCKDLPLMYARSVFPKKIILENGNLFTDLENNALGEILYQDASLMRSLIKIHKIPFYHHDYRYVKKYVELTENFIWRRESIFYFHQNPLWLCEIFLPDLINMICSKNNL